MTTKTIKEGLARIRDAANEKFLELCEQAGVEPDAPELNGEEDEEGSEDEGGEGGGENSEAQQSGDENTIPTPENTEGGEGIPQNGAEMAAAQAGVEGGAQPAMEIPQEAQMMQGGMDATAAQAGNGGAGAMSPDEEELLKQQMAAQQQAAQ